MCPKYEKTLKEAMRRENIASLDDAVKKRYRLMSITRQSHGMGPARNAEMRRMLEDVAEFADLVDEVLRERKAVTHEVSQL